MTERMIATVLTCLACSVARGQGADKLPSFEVASIKPVPTSWSGRHLCFLEDPARYRCTGVTISLMVSQAYGFKSYAFPTSGDYNSVMYDVEAKAPEGATPDQVKLMLRNLLAERFKMASHFEKKEMTVYELRIAPGGVKFKEAPPETPGAPPARPVPVSQLEKDADGFPIYPRQPRSMRLDRANGLGRIVAAATSLDSMVNYLSRQLGVPVIDSTGLKGNYDYTVTFSLASVNEGVPSPAPPGEASEPEGGGGPPIFAALERQLGLKLEKTRGMIDIFVIDHVEKTPTPN